MDQLALLTIEFYALHPELELPDMSNVAAPQAFLFFNSIAFYLRQNEKAVHPDLEARYTAKMNDVTRVIINNPNARDAVGSAIAHEILRIAAEANVVPTE